VSIDVDGVGALVKLAAERGRHDKPHLKLGSAASTAAIRRASSSSKRRSSTRVVLAVPRDDRTPRCAQAEVSARSGRVCRQPRRARAMDRPHFHRREMNGGAWRRRAHAK